MTVIPNMPEDEYHAHPALSSTQAKLILESPAAYDYVVNQGNRRPGKKAFDFGSAVHAGVLGVGYIVDELDFENYRTKAAQEAKAKSEAAGRIPMLKKEMEAVHACVSAVKSHPVARALLERPGIPEASVFAIDPDTGVEIRCRFDFLPDDRRVAVDLKTARKGGAAPHKFAKSIVEYGYDVSWAHYTHTAALAGEEVVDMIFLVVETEAPFHIAAYRLHPDFKEIGTAKADKARQRLAKARATGKWPGLPAEIITLEPPMFAVYDHIDSQKAGAA